MQVIAFAFFVQCLSMAQVPALTLQGNPAEHPAQTLNASLSILFLAKHICIAH